MKKFIVFLSVFIMLAALSAQAMAAITSSDILKRVKAAEASYGAFKSEMYIESASRSNVSEMGEGYTDILKLDKAVVSFKKPDKIRIDGYAQGIKAAYIQNGYTQLILASMIKKKENLKDSPGKRRNLLDMGFLGSRLWTENNVSVLSADKSGTVKLKFVPKFGDKDKRHDMVWVDSKTLKILRRESYRGNGQLRVKMTYDNYEKLGKLPIATMSTLYNPQGEKIGTVVYKNLKVNPSLSDSIFSLSATK